MVISWLRNRLKDFGTTVDQSVKEGNVREAAFYLNLAIKQVFEKKASQSVAHDDDLRTLKRALHILKQELPD